MNSSLIRLPNTGGLGLSTRPSSSSSIAASSSPLSLLCLTSHKKLATVGKWISRPTGILPRLLSALPLLLLLLGVPASGHGSAQDLKEEMNAAFKTLDDMPKAPITMQQIPPDQHCKSCAIVSEALSVALREASAKGKLSEDFAIQALTEQCNHPDTFAGWDLDINGHLERTPPPERPPTEENRASRAPTFVTWTDRLQFVCSEILDKVGEEELLELFHASGSKMTLPAQKLCSKKVRLCRKGEFAAAAASSLKSSEL
mmetsp:Transcript_7424/g.10704  ORF Transcript_7424/g.10704 Transcript_7424/m.10704 type:complete len:258 (-) Transcript_7424:244-1017(-)